MFLKEDESLLRSEIDKALDLLQTTFPGPRLTPAGTTEVTMNQGLSSSTPPIPPVTTNMTTTTKTAGGGGGGSTAGGGGGKRPPAGSKSSPSVSSASSSATKESSPSINDNASESTGGGGGGRRGPIGLMMIPSLLKAMAVDLYIVHDPTGNEISALKKMHEQLISCMSLLVPSNGTAKVYPVVNTLHPG